MHRHTAKLMGAAALGAVLLGGCAGVKVVGPDGGKAGVPFYTPEPYLLVTHAAAPAGDGGEAAEAAATSGGLNYQIVYLPNLCRRYEVRLRRGFGSAKATPTLADGWRLVSLAGESDSQIDETIAAVAGLVKNAGEVARFNGGGKPAPGNALPAGLYRLRYDASGAVVAFTAPGPFAAPAVSAPAANPACA